MQTDAYKIFELVTVIGFGILLLSDIKNIENESLFWIASLQIVLSGTYIFFYLVSSLSTLIRGTEPDHYNSKELDIYCAVGEIYVLTYASLIQNCRSGGSCSNTYFGGLVFSVTLSSVSLFHTLIVEYELFYRAVIMAVGIYFYLSGRSLVVITTIVFYIPSLLLGFPDCIVFVDHATRWSVISSYDFEPPEVNSYKTTANGSRNENFELTV